MGCCYSPCVWGIEWSEPEGREPRVGAVGPGGEGGEGEGGEGEGEGQSEDEGEVEGSYLPPEV